MTADAATPKQCNWINLENPEGASKNVQSKETGNIVNTRRTQTNMLRFYDSEVM